jgi:hypothetical protein
MQDDVIHCSSRQEARAFLDACQAEQQARTHTRDELDSEREWLRQQEPGEKNESAVAELKRRGIDFDAAYQAFNEGRHDDVETFLEEVSPPLRGLAEALGRRINAALRRHDPAPKASAVGRVSRRPREHRAPSRVRARAPDDDHERPRLTGRERSSLKQLIDRAVRARLATRKECACCGLDLPLAAFRPARRTCAECETSARIERRQTEAVAT